MSNGSRAVLLSSLLIGWTSISANSVGLEHRLLATTGGQSAEQLQRPPSRDENLREVRKLLLSHLQAGSLAEAIELGRNSVHRWPDDAELRHLLGLAYFKGRQDSAAATEFQHAEVLNDLNAATHFDFALLRLDQGQYGPAAEELEKAIKLDPSNALAHLLLGRAYQNTNRTVLGIDQFKAALKLNPELPLGHYHLGFALASLGRNTEAIAEYKKELAQHADDATVLYQLGHVLLQTGDWRSARLSLQKATQVNPQSAEAFYDLGKALLLARDTDAAILAFERCAQLNPTDPSPHYQLARTLDNTGKHEIAQVEWKRFNELAKAQTQTGGMASGQYQ
jgi:tetratricopeptide (TPR) repeat protein